MQAQFGLDLEAVRLSCVGTVEQVVFVLVRQDVGRGVRIQDAERTFAVQLVAYQVPQLLLALVFVVVKYAIHEHRFEFEFADASPASFLHGLERQCDCHSHALGFVIVRHPSQASVEQQLP